MKVMGDVERINLATGEHYRRVAGDGESRLDCIHPDHIRFGPKPETAEEFEKRFEEVVSRITTAVRKEQKMSVRAKFYVQRVSDVKDGSGKHTSVELYPVTSGSEENKQFYRYTPSGKIELSTINEEAAKQFEIGKEYYVDFSQA